MLSPLDGGEKVEVDVVIEATVGQHALRVAVECRDHARPATVEWINELAGRYASLPVDRVVAVSRSGFSAGAKHRAKGTKVNLLTLKEAQETDWPGTFQGWRMAFVEVAPKPRGVRVKYLGESPGRNGVDLLNAAIADASGRIISTVGADAKELYLRYAMQSLREWWPTQAETILRSEEEHSRTVDLSFKVHDRSVVAPDGKLYPISELIIKVACVVRVRKATQRFYEYNGARMTQFNDPGEDGSLTNFSLLLDLQTGKPKSLNVRRTAERRRKRPNTRMEPTRC